MNKKKELETTLNELESKKTTTEHKKTQLESDIISLQQKIDHIKQEIQSTEENIEKLTQEEKLMEEKFNFEMEELSKSMKIVNEKIASLKLQNYENFSKFHKKLLVKNPPLDVSPEVMFKDIEPEFPKIIVKNYSNYNSLVSSSYCYFGNQRNYFDIIKQYLQVCGYPIKNNMVLHHTQQMTEQVTLQIDLFMKSNFCNILKDIIENDILKIILSKIDYETLIKYFKNTGNYLCNNPPFNNIHNFILFIYFLGNNGKLTFTQTIHHKIKEKTNI